MLFALWNSTIGKKAIIAVTGIILFGFVIGHLLGNLQIFLPDGGKSINDYGVFLHSRPAVLWVVRLVLLGALLLHIVTSVHLARRNRAARPVAYQTKNWREASYASRTMIWSGPLIAIFIIYHLLHFTTGQAYPGTFHTLEGQGGLANVHQNVIESFRIGWLSAIYIIAQIMLGLHLSHGAWSIFQSLGFNHPRFTPPLKWACRGLAAAIVAGNISIPLLVLSGLVQ